MVTNLTDDIIRDTITADPFNLYILSQIYAEYLISEAIKQNLPKHKEISGWNFGQQVTILNEIDWLPDEFLINLKAMAELRNKYAHNLNVEESEVNAVIGRMIELLRIRYPPEQKVTAYMKYNNIAINTLLALANAVAQNRKPLVPTYKH